MWMKKSIALKLCQKKAVKSVILIENVENFIKIFVYWTPCIKLKSNPRKMRPSQIYFLGNTNTIN